MKIARTKADLARAVRAIVSAPRKPQKRLRMTAALQREYRAMNVRRAREGLPQITILPVGALLPWA